jgi:hypothetical protein
MTDSYLIRRSHVLTMDAALGDLQNADIRVTGGVIVEIGGAAPGARAGPRT